jgi:hypothetical protein
MARYSTSVVSQTAQLAGANSGTTVNGYIGYWGASATAGFRLRRLQIGMLTTTAVVPTSQQFAVAVHRQTTAPAGTGLVAAVLGQALEIWTPQTDPTVGVIVTNAVTIGTTAPVVTANPLFTVVGNTQSFFDVPDDYIEEIVCNLGTANGIAFVNIGNTLPSGHFIKLTAEIEV